MTELERLKQEIEALKLNNSALKNQNTTLEEKIISLETLNKYYLDKLKVNRQKMFGKKSEMHEGQLSFFDEIENTVDKTPIVIEPNEDTIVVKEHTKKKKRATNYSKLPTEIIEYKIEDTTCPTCGSELHVMNKEIRKELKIIPAEVKIIEHIKYVYACRNCESTGIEATIINAPAPKALIAKSLVSPSIMAHIMNEKYVKAVPLDRQEKDFKRNSIELSKQNLSNWMIKGAKLLEPLRNKLHSELISRDFLHADETTLEVLHEPGRNADSKSYMWVYETSGNTDKHIVIYDYTETRMGLNAKTFLKGFKGYLHTDGYSGYNRLEPDVTICGCWAHARRYFFDSYNIVSKERKSTCIENEFLGLIDKLFRLENNFKNLTSQERLQKRDTDSRAIVKEFYNLVDEHLQRTLPKSTLGEALQYAQNQKLKLVRFLENGDIELSNNRAERAVKPFVIGRKNWIFSNTPSGAKSSAIIYTIIQTAILNNLKPEKYLNYIFTRLQYGESPDSEKLLPWNESLPQEIKNK